MQPEQLMALRRADIKTAVILIFVAALMIVESLNFPLTDSYAGVQNAWYVSPALFPILIGSLLLLCGAILLLKAVVFVKSNAEVATAKETKASWWRFALLVSLIAGQIFGWVPLVDFALAAFIFLFLFIFAFHSDNAVFQGRIFKIWTATSILLILISLFAELSEETRFYVDILVLVYMAVMVWLARSWAQKSDQLNVWKISWKTALVVTIVICPLFRLGMLVPLPTEGIVIERMVDMKYVVRDYWRSL
ncbi:hypothetical protein CBF23_006290 [Marinomonas agarivorans]|nr:hypothetical protein CBF23_006290 [Marinomonas agarivorans]